MEGGTAVVVSEEDHHLLDLPPGFRFHPTDEEIITHYLTEKAVDSSFCATAMGEVDMNKCEPWDLPKKAKMGEKEWFFFCQRDRKYPTGMRTNRATESGYWKATGKDKEIYRGKAAGGRQLVGMKKTLVFYRGRAPKGEKTNWVMHEFRLEGKFSYYNFPKAAKDEWVVCRVVCKNSGTMRESPSTDLMRINNSFVDGLLDSPSSSMPPLMETPFGSNGDSQPPAGSSFTYEDEFKGIGKFSDVNSLSYLMNNHQLQMEAENKYYSTFNPPTNFQASSSSNYNQTPTPIYHSQIIAPSNTSCSSIINPFERATNNLRALAPNYRGPYHELLPNDQCKVEQFSNQSMAAMCHSQETGLSTDITPEISSKQETGRSKLQPYYGDLEGPSAGPISDFDSDSLWNY